MEVQSNTDTASTAALDGIARAAAHLTGAPMAVVSTPRGLQQLFKGRHGVDASFLPREATFIEHVLALEPGGVMVVEDARIDPRLSAHPSVTGGHRIRSYVGTLICDGEGRKIGSLCILDDQTRTPPEASALRMLRSLADAAGAILVQQEMLRAKREKLQTLKMAEAISEVGHWRLDVATGVMTWSDQLYRLHAAEPGSFQPDLQRDIKNFHPDDRRKIRTAVAVAARDGKPFTMRLRLIRFDGETRKIEVRSVAEWDESGQVRALFGVFRDVTEQEELLAKAKRNERRYRLLADNMADVIARVRPDGHSNYISSAVKDIIGYTPADMVGTTAQHYVLDEDKPIFLNAMAEVLETGENRRVQYRVVHRSGEPRWVETHLKRVENSQGDGEVIIVIRHIDERRALEDELVATLASSQKNEQRYRLLAENMGDVITRVKGDGTSKYISSAIETLLGWRYKDMSGQSLDYVYPDDREMVLTAIKTTIEDRAPRTLQHRALHKDGRAIWLESHFRAMSDDAGALGEAVVVMRDISDRKALEAALVAARDRAEAAARAKSEFLANMSHELRTPLTSVVGFAGLLKKSPDLKEEQRRYVERIAGGSEALLAVINDILDYSKLEAGAVELDPQPFDPRDLAQGAVELLEAQCAAKGLSLKLSLGEAMPAALRGDAGRLRQVLLNFLSNAVKFTVTGGVTVRVTSTPGQDGAERLFVSVADTGIGVSDDMVDQLFERFTQADASTTRNFGGTGLGLAISRQLIEMMGGRIGAKGQAGVGSTFWFEVPLPVADVARVGDAAAGAEPLRSARVLMADDAPANRELVSVLLSGLGLDVETVENGEQAVRAMSRDAYDLVLMDLHMPVMDGLQAARAIRAMDGPAARTPIIALTANVGLDQVQACLEAGMNGHLAKPINVSQMAQTLAAWLNDPEGGEAARA